MINKTKKNNHNEDQAWQNALIIEKKIEDLAKKIEILEEVRDNLK